MMEQSPEIITALIPHIGHEKAVELARLMREQKISVRDAIRKSGVVPESEIDGLLAPERLCALGWK